MQKWNLTPLTKNYLKMGLRPKYKILRKEKSM